MNPSLSQPDAYDRAVRELGFEMKAQPSDRMKTEEELAKEEQERLRRLEVRGPGGLGPCLGPVWVAHGRL